jgi:predicted membrane-bound spermidine synthase
MPCALVQVYLLSLASGAVSLGYQVMWFRIYAQRFGSTNLTFALVLVSFIGGLGVGALLSERLARALARRPGWANPLTQVGIIEIGIAIVALLTLVVDVSDLSAGGAFPYRVGASGIFEPALALSLELAVAACGVFAACVLMGMTFPILCHAFRARSVFPSEMYAWNTLGACSGVLLAEFLFLPRLGHHLAFVALAAVNVAIGLTFLAIAARGPSKRGAGAAAPRSERRRGHVAQSRIAPEEGAPRYEPAAILTAAGLAGCVSGTLEVDMFRAVRFAGAITDAAMSFTSFWAIVAIFAASWTVRALGRPRSWIIAAAPLLALIVYALTWLNLHETRGFFNNVFMARVTAEAGLNADVPVATSAYPLSGSLGLLLAFTGVVVFPAYYVVSLLLPTLCNLVQTRGEHIGRAYGLNTVAFAAGAVLFTWIVPSVSLFYAVKLLFVLLAAAAGLALVLRPGRRVGRAVGLAVAAVGGGALLVPRGFDARFFPSYETPAQYPVRALRSNGENTTFVVEHPDGDILYFNSHMMSATSDEARRYMRLMAHVPLLAHPDPRSALLICFGVGNTARAIAVHDGIESIDIVDLNDNVFETADEFGDANLGAHRDPRVRLIHDDGRRFLDRTDALYDLVTSEPPPPRAAGVYRLYSVEYYRSVLDHLTPRGMMTQWLPVNLLSRTAIDRMIATFVSVFPHAVLFVGDSDQLILVGGREPFDAALLERRFTGSLPVRLDLAEIGIREPVSILARFIRTNEGLRADTEGIPVLSDTRNDLAHLVTDPFDPPRIPFDPEDVLRWLTSQSLVSEPLLRRALSDPASLLAVVPDFPVH